MQIIYRNAAETEFKYRNVYNVSPKKSNFQRENFNYLFGIVKKLQKRVVPNTSSNSEVAIEVERVFLDQENVSAEIIGEGDRFMVILQDAWYL